MTLIWNVSFVLSKTQEDPKHQHFLLNSKKSNRSKQTYCFCCENITSFLSLIGIWVLVSKSYQQQEKPQRYFQFLILKAFSYKFPPTSTLFISLCWCQPLCLKLSLHCVNCILGHSIFNCIYNFWSVSPQLKLVALRKVSKRVHWNSL